MPRISTLLALAGSFAAGAALAQGEPVSESAAEAGWTAILYALIVVLIFAMAVFFWFQQRQKRKAAKQDDSNQKL